MHKQPPTSYQATDQADFERVRRELAGAAVPKPEIFYADFLASSALGYSAMALAVVSNSPLRLVAIVVSALALWRAVYFVHEICHLRRGAVPGFSLVWNAVVGIPLGLPSLMIGAHKYHHQRATYGTERDPEYAPIATWAWWQIVVCLVEVLLVVPALALRWGVISPLGVLSKRIRRFAAERLSTLAINPRFRRPQPRRRERREWIAQEFACSLWVWVAAALVFTGKIGIEAIIVYAAITTLALFLNQVRTLVAHHYESDGEPLSMVEQTADTITIGGVDVLTDIVTPLGNRYHALHHWLPNIPYHQLPEIHDRLHEALASGSFYRRRERRGFLDSLVQFARRSRGRARGGKHVGSDQDSRLAGLPSKQ